MKPIHQRDQDKFDVSVIPIVEVITSTGVVLEKSGGQYSGLCPLHQDKETQSLKVYPNTNSWCCFGTGCGGKGNGHRNGGDAIAWLRQKERLSYAEAVSYLHDHWGYGVSSPLPPLVKKKEPPPKPVVPELVEYWHNLLDFDNRRWWFQQRGFADAIIDREWWGWDGERYVIPVWEGEPAHSTCLGVRRRQADDLPDQHGGKYVGLKGHNPATVWGRWYCRQAETILGFAGELDAARAVQDGWASFSVVNGCKAMEQFPPDWPELWFPTTSNLIVVFDKHEERDAGFMAQLWEKIKGRGTAYVFHWPPFFAGKDFNNWRDAGYSSAAFLAELDKQTKGAQDYDDVGVDVCQDGGVLSRTLSPAHWGEEESSF